MIISFPMGRVALWCSLLLVTGQVHADSGGFRGVGRVQPASTYGRLWLDLSLAGTYATGSDYVAGPAPGVRPQHNGLPVNEVIRPPHLLSACGAAALGITDRWDLVLSLPFQYDYPGFRERSSAGAGDLSLATRIAAPPLAGVIHHSLLAGLLLPTGSDGGWLPHRVQHTMVNDTATVSSFHSWGRPVVRILGLWTLGLWGRGVPLSLHLNAGALLVPGASQHAVTGGVAIESSPLEVLTLSIEAWSQVRAGALWNRSEMLRDRIMLSPGVRIVSPAGFALDVGGDICLSALAGGPRTVWRTVDERGDTWLYSTGAAPRFGVRLGFGWGGYLVPRDRDGDGIPDPLDRCPDEPEDFDGFEDEDGCPDPDNDGDGVFDFEDQCPDDPEDFDNFEDEDGCPDLDNDRDGIADVDDSCPEEPEDIDGFEDEDGCPDYDNDRDGILDAQDQCPDDPEDFDNFEDDDGCPERDNDRDGIPDLSDLCPNDPETFNGYKDEDGCPDTVSTKPRSTMARHQILFGVQFRSGASEMTADSYRFLVPIAHELKSFPEIEIEIRGHTDALGGYDANMRLSQMRAETVRQYLLSLGVDGQQVRAVGFGPSSPIDDNRTAAGRARNRRIEIVRLR